MKRVPVRRRQPHAGIHPAEDFAALSRQILRSANQGVARSDFVREVLGMLCDFSKTDRAELRVNEGERYFRGALSQGDPGSFQFEMGARPKGRSRDAAVVETDSPALALVCARVIGGRVDAACPGFTHGGSFYTGDSARPMRLCPAGSKGRPAPAIGGEFRSLAVIRFSVDEDSHGLVLLWGRRPGLFAVRQIQFFEGVVQTIGVALADRRAQAALRERVKELTCLYGIHEVLEKPGVTTEEALDAIAELLPPAWLYPDIASARIVLDEREFRTAGFREGVRRQAADISVRRARRGFVEVNYCEPRPGLDEGPFLRDERSLIDAVARQVGAALERRHAAEERGRLEAQLRHADRLATIGQLAAGVAHELNEPLGNVLGFAQLALKAEGLPDQARKDTDKIVTAALHAREVVSKLMLFARQKPPATSKVNLNSLVGDALYFLEARSRKAGIEMERVLAPDLPEITADPGQVQQVLVNLVVNAIQAMGHGGRLTIETRSVGGSVILSVEDTGAGMTQAVLKQIFVPFFTTKGIGEGTGLGLPVVHGIVTAHGGTIEVRSAPGCGSRFDVRLPVAGPPTGEESTQNGN